MIYRCFAANCRAAHHEMDAGSGPAPAHPRLFPAVDMHCHVLSLEVERLVADRPQKLAELEQSRQALGEASAVHNATRMQPAVREQLTDIQRRLADMDAMGVQVQVVSPAPNQYYYWADEALAERIVETQNEEIAQLAGAHRGRIEGLGNVALQHPGLAVQQLQRALALGLKGVEISSAVGGRELADLELDAFWALAERTGAVIFLHPLGTSASPRLNRHYLTNVIGQPLETTIALSHMIFSGLFDRHPRLKLVAAHGGGYLASYVGRMAHAYRVRPEAGGIAHPPLTYLRRLFYDTVVHDDKVLRHLVGTVGASQLVLGTDYPYDMGDARPRDLIAALAELSPQEQQAVLGGNAAGLLGLQLHPVS